MGIDLQPCRECGKKFRPCSTKIDGALTWRRLWCSAECYQNSLRKEIEISPLVYTPRVSKKKKAEPVVGIELVEIPPENLEPVEEE